MWRFFFLFCALTLAGCNREPAVITPPKDAAAVIEPFLKEMAAGQRARAAALVSPAAQDELTSQFAADHKKLAAAPKLTPRYVDQVNVTNYGSADKIVLVYAAKKDDKWTTATLRLFRVEDQPYKVEYWRITNDAPQPTMVANTDPKFVKMQQQLYLWMAGGLVVFGLAGLALLIWIIRRRPHLVVNEAPNEDRQAASTVRDEA